MDSCLPEFDPTSFKGLSSPVWIRLPHLPLMCWDRINIARISARVGCPLWIDATTHEWGRMEYARVCVHLDLSKPLPGRVPMTSTFSNFFQVVEYEGIASLCSSCGCIGHSDGSYKVSRPNLAASRPPHRGPAPPVAPARDPPPVPPQDAPPTALVQAPVGPHGAGLWSLVKHRRRRLGNKATAPQPCPPPAHLNPHKIGPMPARPRQLPPQVTREQQPQFILPSPADVSCPVLQSPGQRNGEINLISMHGTGQQCEDKNMDLDKISETVSIARQQSGHLDVALDGIFHAGDVGSGLEMVPFDPDGTSLAPLVHRSSAALELVMLGPVDIVSHKRTDRKSVV